MLVLELPKISSGGWPPCTVGALGYFFWNCIDCRGMTGHDQSCLGGRTWWPLATCCGEGGSRLRLSCLMHYSSCANSRSWWQSQRRSSRGRSWLLNGAPLVVESL